MITYLVHRRAGHGRLEVVGRGLPHARAPSQRYAGRSRPRSAVSSAGRRRVGRLGRLGGRAAALGSSGGRPKRRPRASTKRYSSKRPSRTCLDLRDGAGWGDRTLPESAKHVHIFPVAVERVDAVSAVLRVVVGDDSLGLLKKREERKHASKNANCRGLFVAARTRRGRTHPWLVVGGDRRPPRDHLLKVSALNS